MNYFHLSLLAAGLVALSYAVLNDEDFRFRLSNSLLAFGCLTIALCVVFRITELFA